MLKKSRIMFVVLLLLFIGISTYTVLAEDFLELVKDASPEEVKEAIEAGAIVNTKNTNGYTALMAAAQDNNNPEVIEILLDNGADVNERGESGRTVLMKAALFNNNPEIIEMLLDKGADINAKDEDGMTALMGAALFNNNPEVVEILLDRGADINARDENGITALMEAARNNNPEVVKTLLDKGADINARDKNDITVLMRASWYNDPEVVEILLDKGADINAKDEDGVTALMGAARNNNLEIVEILLNRGADVTTNMFENSIESIKPNMSFDVEKEVIKDYADIHGWQKTTDKIGEKYISYYEEDEDFAKWIRGTLWSPTLTWVDYMYEVDLYFKDEQVAETRYENFKTNSKNTNSIHLTLRITSRDKEEIKLENLTFILEANGVRRYRDIDNADVSSRGIESKSALGITSYSNVVDLFFFLEDLDITSLDKLKLYTIFEKSRERAELDWNLYPARKADIQESQNEFGHNLIQTSPLPVYPKDLAIKGKSGTVVIEAIIDSNGDIKEVKVLQSSGEPSMDRNAKSTIENGWSFKPYKHPYIKEIKVRYGIRYNNNESYPIIDVEIMDWSFDREFSYKNKYEFNKHSKAIDSLAISPNGLLCASGSYDGSIKVWNLETGEEIITFYGHDKWEPIVSLAFSPGGDKIISGSGDVKIWEVRTGSILNSFTSDNPYIWSVDFSPRGNLIAFSHKEVEVWDLNNNERIMVFDGHVDNIWSVEFAPYGSKIVSSGEKVVVWDYFSGEISTVFTEHTEDVGTINISKDGNKVVSGSLDETIKVWDIDSGDILYNFTKHTGPISAVKFNSRNDKILSSSWDGSIKLWDDKSGNIVSDISQSEDIWSADISPWDNLIVSGDSEGKITVWELEEYLNKEQAERIVLNSEHFNDFIEKRNTEWKDDTGEDLNYTLSASINNVPDGKNRFWFTIINLVGNPEVRISVVLSYYVVDPFTKNLYFYSNVDAALIPVN